MDKFIINEKATLLKNVLIDSDSIRATDENYISKDAFLEKIKSPKKILDTRYTIAYNEIVKFIPEKSELAIQLFFKDKEKTKKTYFEFISLDEYTEINKYLQNKTNFTAQKETKSSYSSWIKPALYTFLVLIFSVITYFMALDIEKGNTITASGSRRGLKKIFIMAAENLGNKGILIVGLVLFTGFLYYTYLSYQKGKKEITVYS